MTVLPKEGLCVQGSAGLWGGEGGGSQETKPLRALVGGEEQDPGWWDFHARQEGKGRKRRPLKVNASAASKQHKEQGRGRGQLAILKSDHPGCGVSTAREDAGAGGGGSRGGL